MECTLQARAAADAEALRAAGDALATERAEALAAAGALAAAATQLVEARTALTAEFRAGVGPVVLAMARRVAGEGLRVDDAALGRLVDEVVEALGSGPLVLRVAPADVERIRAATAGRGLQVEADATVDGGLVGVAPGGSFDASLGSGFEAMRAVVDAWTLSA